MHEKIEDKICNPSPFTLASNPTRSHGSAQFLLLQDTNGCKCAPIDVWCLNLKSIAMRYCEKKVSHIYISTAACPAGHRCDDQVQTTIASSFSSDACHHKDYIWRKASLSKSKIVWTFWWKFCLFTDEQRALCKVKSFKAKDLAQLRFRRLAVCSGLPLRKLNSNPAEQADANKCRNQWAFLNICSSCPPARVNAKPAGCRCRGGGLL